MIQIGIQISSALAYLHHTHISHGSVTPKTIFVSDDLEICKLGSYSNLRKLDAPDSNQLQTQSTADIYHTVYSINTLSNDIYQLGLLLYTALTGDEDTDMEYRTEYATARFPMLTSQPESKLRIGLALQRLPQGIAAVIEKCIIQNSSERASAQEIHELLVNLQEPVT